MLGYRPEEFPGRAVFEALGRGQDVNAEHVFAYAALRPAERRDDGWWLTGRPDPERDADEAERLVARCDGITVDGLTFSLSHVWRGEAVLRISGGADERVTDSDAFFRDRHPVLRPQPIVSEAARTARAAEEWSREVMRRLEGERCNVITLKWFGRPGPVRHRRSRRPRRRRRQIRGVDVCAWDPRPPARTGHDAGVAQCRGSPALPRVATDALRRRRRLSGRARPFVT